MVTIRISRERLEKLYGNDSTDIIRTFSGVIGYTVESENDISVELNPDRLDLASYPTLIDAANHFYGRNRNMEFFFPRSVLKKEYLMYTDSEAQHVRPFIYIFTAMGPSIGENLDLLIEYQERIHDSVGKNRVLASIGIHDLDRIEPPFRYRTVSGDFKMTAYDGFRGTVNDLILKHPKGMEYGGLVKGEKFPAIFDSEDRLLSLPPIVNGSDSKLSEETKNFLVDLTGTEFTASASAFYLLLNFFRAMGYAVEIPKVTEMNLSALIDYGSRKVNVSYATMKSYIGDFNHDSINQVLRRMGYSITMKRNGVIAQVPAQRNDVMGEVDVIEDIAKGIGYSSIAVNQLTIPARGKGSEIMNASRTMKFVCTSLGYQEIMSFFITSPKLFSGERDRSGYHVVNPKSIDSSVIRSSLYPSLLWNFSNNRSRATPQKIFEIGPVVEMGIQRQHLCLGEFGSKANFNEARSVLDSLIYRITAERPTVQESTNKDFISGRSGDVYIGKKRVGVMGELSPEVLTEFALTLPVTAIEIDIGAIL